MSPKTKKQFEGIRESKKKMIMDTALELFANEGFYNTTVSKIAKVAGISKGLLYNYFDNKEALIREIVFKGIDDIIRYFDPNQDGVLTDEEFVFFISESFRIFEENRKFWKLYFLIVMQPSVMQLIYEKLNEKITPLINTMSGYFERKGSKDPIFDAMFFQATLDGIFINYVSNPSSFSLSKLKEKVIDVFNCYVSHINYNQ